MNNFELYGFYLVFTLIFLGALATPTRILDKYEVGILLLVILPFLGWFVRLTAKEIKQDG